MRPLKQYVSKPHWNDVGSADVQDPAEQRGRTAVQVVHRAKQHVGRRIHSTRAANGAAVRLNV
jgi:hypothetical protein